MVMGIGVELQLTERPQSKEADGKLHAEVKRCFLVNLPLLDLVVSRLESIVSQAIP